jgi:hypothetical protein
MKLSSIQKDILIGTILGDAYLQKTGEKNARLRLEHGGNQKEYLLWKVQQLKQFFQGRQKYLERMHPLTRRTYTYWRHQSQSTPLLGKFRKIFYQGGRKIIPKEIKKFLTPRSIAVWYMDDGYYYQRDKCSYIYLGNITKAEAGVLKQAFAERFDISVYVWRKKKGFALYFSRKEAQKLKILIQNYILEQFIYKLPS